MQILLYWWSNFFTPLIPSLMSIRNSGRGGDLAVDVVVRDGHDVLVVVAVVADVVDGGGGGVGGVGGAVGRRSLRTAFQGAGQPVPR